jgi:ArsR family transcriptional regulator
MKPKLENNLLKVYEARSKILKAMAHPTRLFILDQLHEKPLCVCEINEMIPADVSTISKHLSVMKNAGILSSKKQGLQVFYKLEMPCILNSLRCIQNLAHKD